MRRSSDLDNRSSLNMSMKKEPGWKPDKDQSYETLVLTQTELNEKLRPAGFRSNNKHRQIKNTCMISKIRTRCHIRNANPKLAICITMYNEKAEELIKTLEGCLHNYNCMKAAAKDKKQEFTKDDFLIVVIADGYDKIPECMKKLGRAKGFLDEEVLFQKGFMELNRDKTFKMSNIRDIMDDDIMDDVEAENKIPKNILHCFQITTRDFGLT